MGYTHYWTIKNAISQNSWDKIIDEVKPILEANKDIIRLEYDASEPAICDANCIRFNGIEDDGHETFQLRLHRVGFNFCKTARKPYDKVVVEVLKKVKEIVPNWITLSSDGDGEIDGKPIFN